MTKCISNGFMYPTNPPQYKCEVCGKMWFEGNVPECGSNVVAPYPTSTGGSHAVGSNVDKRNELWGVVPRDDGIFPTFTINPKQKIFEDLLSKIQAQGKRMYTTEQVLEEINKLINE